jgi:hypothetical protein
VRLQRGGSRGTTGIGEGALVGDRLVYDLGASVLVVGCAPSSTAAVVEVLASLSIIVGVQVVGVVLRVFVVLPLGCCLRREVLAVELILLLRPRRGTQRGDGHQGHHEQHAPNNKAKRHPRRVPRDLFACLAPPSAIPVPLW